MRRWARLVAPVLVLAAAGAFAREADVSGWGETRWGMTNADLDAQFGERLRTIDPPLVYHEATVGRSLPETEVGGFSYRALFQMDAQGQLQQVLLERRNAQATPAAFQAAVDELRNRHGQPDRVCDTPRTGAESSPIERERLWVLPTTTIHLSFLDYRGGILYRDPQQDIDPLVSELESRLYARRSLPRRLLIRYHPTDRADLMGEGCVAP
ncbi:hypothetical protein [Rhodospirillaceae bacterium SYSU D60014]|uniref:hypothetical protein n=1 Tax=Virgifigura deserti TaxID=2268457 RepID=UPI000E6753CB